MPGVSVAKLAMAHGINANIVHDWRKLAREAHKRRAHEARGPRQQFGSCCCGYGDATDKDAACEAAKALRWIVDRWSNAERKAGGR